MTTVAEQLYEEYAEVHGYSEDEKRAFCAGMVAGADLITDVEEGDRTDEEVADYLDTVFIEAERVANNEQRVVH